MGPAGGDFLSRLLVYIPENRLSAEQALLHPFLSRVMFSAEQQKDLLRVQAAGNVGVLLLTGKRPQAQHTVSFPRSSTDCISPIMSLALTYLDKILTIFSHKL